MQPQPATRYEPPSARPARRWKRALSIWKSLKRRPYPRKRLGRPRTPLGRQALDDGKRGGSAQMQLITRLKSNRISG